MISILYVNRKSNYDNFSELDIWKEEKNALLYRGKNVIIAHPPCRAFGRLRSFSNHPGCELFMAYSAIAKVRRFGGIVEHPISSTLWEKMKIGSIKSPDQYGGYLIKVNLSDFGFKAKKPTGLYIVGLEYKDLPAQLISFNAITHSVCTSRKSAKKELDVLVRSQTPINLINWMLEVCNLIMINNSKK